MMNKPPLYRRPSILITAASLVTVLALAVLLAPYGISYGVKQWIEENGGDQVTIEDVDFNPFTGNLAIHNLHVKRLGKTPLTVAELKLDLVLSTLLQKRVTVEGISILGVNIQVDQSEKEPLRIGGIKIDGSKQASLETEVETPWSFAIRYLELRQVEIDYIKQPSTHKLRIDKLEINDLANAEPEQETTLKLDGALDDAKIRLSAKLRAFSTNPGFKGKLEWKDVALARYSSWLPATIKKLQGKSSINSDFDIEYRANGEMTITQKGEVSLADTQLTTDTTRFTGQRLDWKGQSVYSGGRQEGFKTALDGDIALHDIQLTTDTGRFTGKTVHWHGKTDYLSDKDSAVRVKLNGGIGLTGSMLELPDKALKIEQEEFSWSGNSDISLPADNPTISVTGKTDSKQFRLVDSQRDTDLQYMQLTWDGGVKIDLASDKQETGLSDLTASGNVAAQSFSAIARNENYLLMAFEHLDISNIDAAIPKKASSDQVELTGLTLGLQQDTQDATSQVKAPGLVHYGKVALNNLQYTQNDGLAIDSIRQTDVTQITRRTREGQWNAARFVDSVKQIATTNKPDTKNAKQEESLRLRVNDIVVDGDSKVIFEDQQTDPQFRQELRIKQASLEKLDSHKPEQASPVKLEGVIGADTEVKFSGVVSPFAKRLTMDIKGNIGGLPMPPLSSYSSKLLGYTLDSGKMDADISLKADAGKLDGANKLDLYQLAVTPLSPDKQKELDAKLDVPLETGLSMLRDKNNKIQLSLPLTGDVDNFQLDPSDAINQVVGKAMKTAAKTYLSAALFPYGTLLTVITMAGDKAMKISLDPVFYTPGSTRLGTKDMEYLGKVAKILGERPEIHVKLCGIATETDKEFLMNKKKEEQDKKKTDESQDIDLDKQLEQLAQTRADLIEKYLVEEHNTKANRLISCQPRIEKQKADSKPRTELTL